ncbi:MAG: hypothetical protein LIP09_04040 [Bacteroidales bacterium]|nr:hypothetical protein [Bacteroidales bacterium]
MKNLLFLILFLMPYLTLSAQSSTGGSTTKTDLDIYTKSNNPKTNRAPLRLDIEVTCDACTRTVVVTADDSLEGEVYILLDGATVDYSPVVNSAFYIPEASGQYTIEIEGSAWIATGVIPL